MENMDQVIEQSTTLTMDETQQAQETATDEKQDAQTEQGAQEKAEDAAAHEDSELDFQSLGEMSAGDQLAYLRQRGYLDHDADDEKPEQNQKGEQAGQAKEAPAEDDPEYEITVDGEPVKVKLSELKNGYQRQADYTRKTQALADERRQVDAMMAALKVKQGTQEPEAEKANPEQGVSSDYKAAVAQAEKDLGIAPGEFNQFDPEHNFALQRVIVRNSQQQASQQATQSAVIEEVRNFVAKAQADPMTPEIDNNYDVYLFKLGQSSPEGAQKAMAIAQAKQRFYNNQATTADTKILREHWDYVRSELMKAKAPASATPTTPTPKPEPPKTETPGQAAGKTREPFNARKLRGLDTKSQIAALRRAGFM